jgi:hypothetical protein
MKEEWKDVIGFEGLYKVSNLGRVKSLPRKNQKTEMILKDRPNTKPNHTSYNRVAFRKDGKSFDRLVHRIVAFAFIPNPENKPHINHIDNNGMNNRVDNLEWVNRKENQQHSVKQGRQMGKLNQVYGTRKMSENALNRAKKHIGKEFGWTTVLDVYSNGKAIRAKVKCKCGNEREVSISRLLNGFSQYCRSCTQKINKDEIALAERIINELGI